MGRWTGIVGCPTEGEVGISPHEIPRLSRTRAQGLVPMEEREARANRFVSLLEGTMETEKQESNSSKQLPLLMREAYRRAVVQEDKLRVLAVGLGLPVEERSVPPSDPMNPTTHNPISH